MKKKFPVKNQSLAILAFVLITFGIFAIFSEVNYLKTKSTKIAGTYSTQSTGRVYKKNAYVLIYNPTLANGQKLNQYLSWNDPDSLASQYIEWLKTTTNNKVNYTKVEINEVNDFPTFTDGRKYDETTYLACLNNTANCLRDSGGNWMMMDYTATINAFGLCDSFNAGTIDELWMFGAPYMGWWEANQTGYRAFGTNGPVINGTSCNKPMNIMGFSYERGLAEMVEDLMHRIEGTMSTAYGSWQENRMVHNWDKFGLVAYQSPNYGFSGCGSCHYAPNSTEDYQWGSNATASTYCDEFFNYPDPIDVTNRRNVTCAEWGCSPLGYFRWWLQRFPSKYGVAPDNKYADWWKYVIEPISVYDHLTYVPPITATPVPIIVFTITPTTLPIPIVTLAQGETQGPATPTPIRNINPPGATNNPDILQPVDVTGTPQVTIVSDIDKIIIYDQNGKEITPIPIGSDIDQSSNGETNNIRDNGLSIALFTMSGLTLAAGVFFLIKFFLANKVP